MIVEKTDRGFEILQHEAYPPEEAGGVLKRLAQQSSLIGDYPDAFDRPGTSYLWIGEDHHLNREQVLEFAAYLMHWLATGKFSS